MEIDVFFYHYENVGVCVFLCACVEFQKNGKYNSIDTFCDKKGIYKKTAICWAGRFFQVLFIVYMLLEGMAI